MLFGKGNLILFGKGQALSLHDRIVFLSVLYFMGMQELPNHQKTRAKRYDYTSAGAYFLTICTKDHERYF